MNYKFSRYAMYKEIEEFFKKEPRNGKVLFIGEALKFEKVSKIYHMFPETSERIITHYPGVDVQELTFIYSKDSFDYIVADQVFEHVRNPWKGIDEIYRVLKPGGWLLLTSCLMMHLHLYPDDYWRFTPKGLEVLCEKFSKIEQCTGSGSYKVVKMCEEGYRGKVVEPGSNLEKIALENDKKYWNHVWIITQK